MKIGIFLPDVSSEAGGASSLLRTIKKEIKSSCDEENEYIFLYYGGQDDALILEVNGFKYLNLNYYKNHVLLGKRIKNKIKRKLGIATSVSFSKFDAAAKDIGIDMFWFTMPGIYDCSYPYIYTVWDLGHRRNPFFPEVSRSGWMWECREQTFRKMLYKASYILTGNKEGKKEILENYPVPPQKIIISPFPVAEFCHNSERTPDFPLPEDFFFYPAQFWPHKNHIVILDALVYLRDVYNMAPSVIFTGSDKGNRQYIESKVIEYNLSEQVLFTGLVDDEVMKYLYTHAVAMIFASLMGPNNMPPIEATYLNCPVIITSLDGHKEQLGDSALYFDGHNSQELAAHMKAVLSDGKMRNDLKARQKPLIAEFGSINYFETVKKIIAHFSKIRRTWGVDYDHL